MPPTSKPPQLPQKLPQTARSLPMALIRAREKVMAPIRDMLHDTGLTEQQWRVLRVLEECGPLDGSEVAERAGLLAPSLTRIARTLQQRALVSRKQDDEDRRRHVLMITPTGLEVIAANQQRASQIADRFRTGLGPDRYEQLLDLLAELDASEFRK